MKKIIKEETVLFLSVLKWFFIASLSGLSVGVFTAGFLKTLDIMIGFAGHYRYFYLSMPFIFLISHWVIKYMFPDAREHNTNNVIEALHQSRKISFFVVPKIFIASILTIASGGSAGKEAPCADIGAGVSSLFGRILRLNPTDIRKLIICGVSAGFASTFGVPLSGAIFGVEVLFVGKLLYEVLFPSLVAGISSYYISSRLGIAYFREPLYVLSAPSEALIIEAFFAGVFFGLISLFIVETMKLGKRIYTRMTMDENVKVFGGGAVLAAITMIVGPKYLGLGMDTVLASLKGTPAHFYDFFFKSVFTTITLNFGGSGGIITPLFFIGSTSGNLFGQLIGNDSVATFAGLGMVSVIAGACNTPLAASIMAVELFGPAIAPYAIISCVVSFLVTGHRGVYQSQILSFRKSDSIIIHQDGDFKEIRTEISIREHTLLYYLFKLSDKIKRRFKR